MASPSVFKAKPKPNLQQQDLSKWVITSFSSNTFNEANETDNVSKYAIVKEESTTLREISSEQTEMSKNEVTKNIIVRLQRVPASLIRMYCERSDLRYESRFLEKQLRCKKSLPPTELEDEPLVSKKMKYSKGKQEKEIFIIEKILDFKFQSGKEVFYIKWQGWPDSENTWEPIENLDNCPKILSKFLSEQEQKYVDTFESIKEEISFDHLTSDENLTKRIKDAEDVNVLELKEKLLLKLLSIMTLEEREEKHATQLILDSRNVLQLYILMRRRCQQLISLKNWEEHINHVDKCKKICVENEADLAGPPENFTYINQSIPGLGVSIPDEPPIGCDCEACNCRSKSCCGMTGGLFAYTVKKRLRVAAGTPIYECNKACKCPEECNNRVVQGGRSVKLCIFRTANGCGWGVKSDQIIRKGQFICQYVGEVITFEEAEKRGREYDANGLTYLFDLDFNSVENPYTVDAAYLGNISHFINHSCNPNLGVWAVWADCLDPNLPMLALFATRDIEVGEEICFDYLQKAGDPDVLPGRSNSTPDETGTNTASVPSDMDIVGECCAMPQSPSSRAHDIRQHRNLTECKCGAFNCRKYLF